jgi:hypothetical protein
MGQTTCTAPVCWVMQCLAMLVSLNCASWSPSYLFFSRQPHYGSWANGQDKCQRNWDTLTQHPSHGLPLHTKVQVHAVGHPEVGNYSENWDWINDNHGPLLNVKSQLVLPSAHTLYTCSTELITQAPILNVDHMDPGAIYWWGMGQTGCSASVCTCPLLADPSPMLAISCGDLSYYNQRVIEYDHYTMTCQDQAYFLCRATVHIDHTRKVASCD